MASELTTLARVKERIGMDGTSEKDTLLDRLIVTVSEFVEQRCNRVFEKADYEEFFDGNKIDVAGYYTKLHVSNPPIVDLLGLHYLSDVDTVDDTGDESENVTLSNLSAVGEPNRTWKNFNWFDISKETGTIMVSVPHGWRDVRVRYTGGFLKDFNNFNDISKHEIPRDITELTEKLVTKTYNKREEEGFKNVTFRDATRDFESFLSAHDQQIINTYKQWQNLL